MNKKWAILIACVVFLLDQIVKHLVLTKIAYGDSINIIPGFFDITHVTNKGVAFGMFAHETAAWKPFLLYGAAVFATVVLIFMYRKLTKKDVVPIISIGLLWGGIAGNVLDRIRFGHVIDYLGLRLKDHFVDFAVFGKRINFPLIWPSFNIADAAITVSLIMLLILSFMGKEIGDNK